MIYYFVQEKLTIDTSKRNKEIYINDNKNISIMVVTDQVISDSLILYISLVLVIRGG